MSSHTLPSPAIYESTARILKNELPCFSSSFTLSGAFLMGHHLFIQSLGLSKKWNVANYVVLGLFDAAFFMGHWGFISLVGRQNKGLQYDPQSRLMSMLNFFRSRFIGVPTGLYQLFNLGLTLRNLLILMTVDKTWAAVLGFGTPFLSIGNVYATFIAPLELAHSSHPRCNPCRLVATTASTLGSTIPIMAFYLLSLLAAPVTLGTSDSGLSFSGSPLEKAGIIFIAGYTMLCLGQFTASLAHIAARYTGYAPGANYNYWVNTICKGKLGHIMAPNFLQFFTTSNYTLLKDFIGMPWLPSLMLGGTIALATTYHFSVNLMAGNPHGSQHQKAGLHAVQAIARMKVLAQHRTTSAVSALQSAWRLKQSERFGAAHPPVATTVLEMTRARVPHLNDVADETKAIAV